jgi:MerR family transcriptional regulator, heat shock protein HspR
MMKMKRKKGFFSISAVAKMFSVHQQTIRLYEKQGLITPNRSDGGTRMFSEEDIDRLENIIYLTHELGINLAGVEMVLKLKKQIKKMQADMNKVFEQTQQQLDLDAQASKEVIATSTQRLLKIRQEQATAQPQAITVPVESEQQQAIELENWSIDYEE